MALNEDIDIFKALDWLRDSAPLYAKAKAERVYLEEYRKSKKAMLMKAVEKDYPSAAGQEREAYSNPEYIKLLEALKIAVEQEETLRWRIVACEARIECWRSLESSRRFEANQVK